MCGRFTLTSPAQVIAEAFAVDEIAAEFEPEANIAPGSQIPVVRTRKDGRRQLSLLRWGLVPSWSKDLVPAGRMFNARGETAADKPAFRAALLARRCIVPADGFYEWQPVGGRKQALLIRREDGAPFGIAALWEGWRAPDGNWLRSCTLLTTAPNALLEPIHDRMPVILAADSYALWLDPAVRDLERVKPLIAPCSTEGWKALPVELAAPPRAAKLTSDAPATTTPPTRSPRRSPP
jgi:putative SOS response-associated peptidase YedK